MEIPKKASIREILDPRILSLIATQLDKEDQKSFVEALTLPKLKTNIKEYYESKTQHKLPKTSNYVVTPQIISIMTQRMVDGLAPPRSIFTLYDWSHLNKGRSLNQTILFFIREYLKHFELRTELLPMIQSLDWKTMKGNSGHKTIDYLINEGIMEWVPLPNSFNLLNVSNALQFGLKTVIEYLIFDITGQLDNYEVEKNELERVMLDTVDLKPLLVHRSKKWNKVLKPVVENVLENILFGRYHFDSKAYTLLLSILGGVMERASEYSTLSEFYFHLPQILNPSKKNKLEQMKEEGFYNQENLYDVMAKLETDNEWMEAIRSRIREELRQQLK